MAVVALTVLLAGVITFVRAWNEPLIKDDTFKDRSKRAQHERQRRRPVG
jgi:hypothetical protein